MSDRAIIGVLAIGGLGFAAWEWWRMHASSAVPAAGIPQSGGAIDAAKAAAIAAWQQPAPPPAGATGQGLTLGQLSGLKTVFSGFLNLIGGLPNGTSQAQGAQAQNTAQEQQGPVPQTQAPAVTNAAFHPGSGVDLGFGGSAPASSSAPSLSLPGMHSGDATMGTSSLGISSLLDTIAGGEANDGYNSVYAGSPIRPPQALSTMTVAQVQAFQNQMVAAGSRSSAVGRYQFLRTTLAGLVSQGVLSPGEVFGPAAQDRAATALLNRRGLSQYQSGQLSATGFANNLAKEWASLPVVSGTNAGQSYYSGTAGNAARVGISDILGAIGGVSSSAST